MITLNYSAIHAKKEKSLKFNLINSFDTFLDQKYFAPEISIQSDIMITAHQPRATNL